MRGLIKSEEQSPVIGKKAQTTFSVARDDLLSFFDLVVDACGFRETAIDEKVLNEARGEYENRLPKGERVGDIQSCVGALWAALGKLLFHYRGEMKWTFLSIVRDAISKSSSLPPFSESIRTELKLTSQSLAVKKFHFNLNSPTLKDMNALRAVLRAYSKDRERGVENKERYVSMLRSNPPKFTCFVCIELTAVGRIKKLTGWSPHSYSFPLKFGFDKVPFTKDGLESLRQRVEDFVLNFVSRFWGDYLTMHLYRTNPTFIDEYIPPHQTVWHFDSVVKNFVLGVFSSILGGIPSWLRDFMQKLSVRVYMNSAPSIVDEGVNKVELRQYHAFRRQIKRDDALFYTIHLRYDERYRKSVFFLRFAISWLARKLAVIVGFAQPHEYETPFSPGLHIATWGSTMPPLLGRMGHTFVYTEVDIPQNLSVDDIPALIMRVLSIMMRKEDVQSIFRMALFGLLENCALQASASTTRPEPNDFTFLKSLSFQAEENNIGVRATTDDVLVTYKVADMLGWLSKVEFYIDGIDYEVYGDIQGVEGLEERLFNNVKIIYNLKRVEPASVSSMFRLVFFPIHIELDRIDRTEEFLPPSDADAIIPVNWADEGVFEQICDELLEDVRRLLSLRLKNILKGVRKE